LIFDRHVTAIAWKAESWAQADQKESEWVLIPKSDPDSQKVPWDKHFRSKTIADQAEVLKHYAKDYREAKALEVMTSALLNDVVHGERILSDCWLHTQELNSLGGRACVGHFSAVGLGIPVFKSAYGDVRLGCALARKLKT
jgi:hypothetical protein